jgi:hypothetical protein
MDISTTPITRVPAAFLKGTRNNMCTLCGRWKHQSYVMVRSRNIHHKMAILAETSFESIHELTRGSTEKLALLRPRIQ